MFKRLRHKLSGMLLESMVEGVEMCEVEGRRAIKINLTRFGCWLTGGQYGASEQTEEDFLAARISAAVERGKHADSGPCPCGETHGLPKAKA